VTALLLGGMLLATTGAGAQDATASPTPEGDVHTATGGARASVALTIYNQGTALVRDTRRYAFTPGLNRLDFTDVAAGIDPTSVSFRSLTDADGTAVLEQNYVYDLVGSDALLQRYLDETIRITMQDGTEYTGQLLSGRNGELIVRGEAGEVRVIQYGFVRDIRFPDLPGGLLTRPTLRWLLQAAAGGEQTVELVYLTGGLNWTADYNILLAADNASLDLSGWVTLNNGSGTSYTDANVRLVAGDLNRIVPERMQAELMALDEAMLPAAAPQVETREFSEYHLYEIARPVTVAANETKQVEFISVAGVAASTYYVYEPGQPYYGGYYIDQYFGTSSITTVGNFLEFSTTSDGGVGADLPAGRIRVYQQDVDGAALLIGENRIDHTPQGETVDIYLGNAFDLVGERMQRSYTLVAANVVEETYEIRLRNRKDVPVEIRVVEHLARYTQWEILDANVEYTQTNATTIEFRPTVQPGEETVITYTVRYTFPR
jgi:hypothetical protein